MKKIATITWNSYYNFGTYLQAYALQQFLLSNGYDTTVIDDSKFAKIQTNWRYEAKKIAWLLLKSFREYKSSNKQAKRLYDEFKKSYLKLDYCSDSKHLNSNYDIFVCGSDQIWNPNHLSKNPYASFYYADFTSKTKIAYAPSIGISSIPSELKTQVANLIKDFKHLSAREDAGCKLLTELSNKEVRSVVDPCLLLDRDKWSRLLDSNLCSSSQDKQNLNKSNALKSTEPVKRQYILAYFLTNNTNYISAAKAYAQKKGLPLKMFFLNKDYYKIADELLTAGPLEFLNAIKNAEMVFTDSFHASIFAAIFQTQFITFKRFKDVSINQDSKNASCNQSIGAVLRNQNSRVENLLSKMGIGEHLLDESQIDQIDNLPDIDFQKVEENIAPYIEESKKYLLQALLEIE